jgi:NADPH-dependent 2,4-dienoyl-CoA reductase/sulfur reductase-like enzyme
VSGDEKGTWKYDVVVVGGGVAGLAAAEKLTQAGLQVVQKFTARCH